jgi:hypothetical protein
MMCKRCSYWQAQGKGWGDCLSPTMRFSLVPYTQKPDHVPSLEVWNWMQTPHPVPLTQADYRCPSFQV